MQENNMRKAWIPVIAALMITFAGPTLAGTKLKEFRRSYELKPVRGYTFLGTENSLHQLWVGDTVRYDKPSVEPNGIVARWFNPADHVSWVGEAMKSGDYDFGLVDGFLPAVWYIYRKSGSDETCEMTAFATDSPVSGEIIIFVGLIEKTGGKKHNARYLRLPDSVPVDQAAFKAALQSVREQWTRFFAQGTEIRCDDPELLIACKASIVRALITFTGKRPHYGVRSYGPGEAYEIEYGDGFPPTIISLVDCLLEWGQAPVARNYLAAYFDEFVREDGQIKYIGPSLSEYGQFLWLIRKCMDAGGSRDWFDHIRPKIERIRTWVLEEQAKSPSGLLAGVPEADKRKDVDVYFHNNGWLWRGLRDIAPLLGHAGDADRCRSFRKTILAAIDKVTDWSVMPPFIPPIPRRMKPFQTMTQDDFASYTNYRYWPELLSCGILSKQQLEAIIAYRNTRDGEIAGLARIWDHADNWPLVEYAAGLRALGQKDEIRRILYSHLAGHTTPETWTAYEQVAIEGSPYRDVKADYCVPVQLVAPRLMAWLYGTPTRFNAASGLAPEKATRTVTPSRKEVFETRGVVLTPADLSLQDWPERATKAGLTTIALHPSPSTVLPFVESAVGREFLAKCARLGLSVEYELHAMGELLPRRLFAMEPGAFRMNEKGERTPDANLCVHSTRALEIVSSNMVSIARKLRPSTGRYFFWGDDGKPWCHCRQCREFSDSDQALLLENHLVRELRRLDPNAALAHLAYSNTLAPPTKVKPEPGVFLEFAPIDRRYDLPYSQQTGPKTKDALTSLIANLQVFPSESAQVLEYWLDASRFSQWRRPSVKLPWRREVMVADAETYAKYGIRHVTTFAVYLDADYVKQYGAPSEIQEYGDILRTQR